MKKLLALLALLLLAAAPARASVCPTLPYTFSNGTVIDATQMNSMFTTLQGCVNAVPNSIVYTSLPQGRLSLSSTAPVMTSAVTGATTVYYVPYTGYSVPLWNGSTFVLSTAATPSQALSDTSLSPAAAVANTCYDVFIWANISGNVVLSRGPAWSSLTARSLALARQQGVLVNGTSITNGPAANYGTYVGTICTDPAAVTVSFNPNPGPVVGGPPGGAWVGLWNYYNRVTAVETVQDDTTSWSYGTNVGRPADNSTNNRGYFVVGVSEDAVQAVYGIGVVIPNTAYAVIYVSLNSSSGVNGIQSNVNPTGLTQLYITQVASYNGYPPIGENYIQATEAAGGTASTFYGHNSMQLQITARY